MRFTLDTNCLIDLEQASTRTAALKELIRRWRSGAIQLCVPAISASERTQSGADPESYTAFAERLDRLGLGDAEQLFPMAYFDICFWDRCLFTGPEMEALERRIHDVLHPTIPFGYEDFCASIGVDPATKPADAKWRNAKCDVQILWSHIWHKSDVLVTNDRNFVKATKLPQLLAPGAGRIVNPDSLP